MKEKILKLLLSAEGGCVSGEEMSRVLGITRSAVWKNIKELREEGWRIEAATKRGYRLDIPDDALCTLSPQTEFMGRELVWTYSCDSTNSAAKRRSDMIEGTVFASEVQTAGRGRLGRSWLSPPGCGIWMSVLLRPPLPPAEVAPVTLAAGLAVAETVGGTVKWPNDVVMNGKKVCGILTEMSAEMERVDHIVVGIGVNANTSEFPAELMDKATSVMLETGKACNRRRLAERILEQFEARYKMLIEGGFAAIREDYKTCSATLGNEVTVIENGRSIRAFAVDIDENGALVVEDENGRRELNSGEVSVRGIYGYL